MVLDISGQSQTAAATARGFIGFQPGVEISGVILNRVASPRHERLARIEFERIGIDVLGVIPRRTQIDLPERHLGLVQASETEGLHARLDALADLAEAHIDVEALLKIDGRQTDPFQEAEGGAIVLQPPAQRIALAQDAAFSFVYPHVIKAWREAGAEILPFAPLDNEPPDASADLVWLPGGYPELHAARLASNARFLNGVRAFAASKPVHGECGGYMALGQGLIDAKGERHEMLGLLGLETSFAARKLHLGYRRAELLHDCVLGPGGSSVGGHEFHYASVISEPDEKLFNLFDSEGAPVASGGSRRGHVTGSFFHFVDYL